MRKIILFLDVDGVLHPYGCLINLYFCELHRIVNILRDPQFDHVSIVVSSSWRFEEDFVDGKILFRMLPLAEVSKFFPEDVRHRIIGTTPCLGELEDGRRELECLQWLEERDLPSCDWVSLDDFWHLFSNGCRNLIRVDPSSGLNDETEHELRQRLLWKIV